MHGRSYKMNEEEYCEKCKEITTHSFGGECYICINCQNIITLKDDE